MLVVAVHLQLLPQGARAKQNVSTCHGLAQMLGVAYPCTRESILHSRSQQSFFLGEKWETPNPFGLQVTENRWKRKICQVHSLQPWLSEEVQMHHLCLLQFHFHCFWCSIPPALLLARLR
ncbi:hypothetical protein Y1Q_0007897 [Alligator mississippiensis]|uniref:Uncharacterized protein n=1 Tax=Alligator mississippiensis TaxID=8496 RepID=A0A151NES4_ALLMI|nr:hypothetical protein Y1Q_0007897 [Alligator mississippiensis]